MGSMKRRRRGLIFWALRLRSFRCWSCHRDLVWRERLGPPLVCHWCHRPTFDLTATVARTTRVIAALAAELTVFGREAQRTADRLDALVWSLYAPGVKPPRLTRVDDPTEQV